MGFKDLYLTSFNAASWAAWTYVHGICTFHLFSMLSGNVTTYSLYRKTIVSLAILQSVQWLEFVHTILRLTKSNLGVQFCQLGGRFNALIFGLLCMCNYILTISQEKCMDLRSHKCINKYIDAHFNSKGAITDESYCNDYLQWGYTLVLYIWSMAEVIRYPFYISKLLNIKSSLIEWLRYNAFIILYPIGFAAEMRCWYGLNNFLVLDKNINDPDINYQIGSISLRGWSLLTFSLTPFVGTYMYFGMIKARKKWMFNKHKDNKKE